MIIRAKVLSAGGLNHGGAFYPQNSIIVLTTMEEHDEIVRLGTTLFLDSIDYQIPGFVLE